MVGGAREAVCQVDRCARGPVACLQSGPTSPVLVRPRCRSDHFQPAPLLGWSDLSDMSDRIFLPCARPQARTGARVRAYTRAWEYTDRLDRLDRLDQASNDGASRRSDLQRGRTKTAEVGPERKERGLSMAESTAGGPWAQGGRHFQEHASGARVVACKGANGYCFLAYGPDRAAGWDYRAWRSGQIPHWSGEEPKARYRRGEAIPQPRAFLGAFDTAAAARACCEAHIDSVRR